MATSIFISSTSANIVGGLGIQSQVKLRRPTDRHFLLAGQTFKPRRIMVVRASDRNDLPVKSSGLSNDECEAAVVAGNIPEAPRTPLKAAAPAGTPVVPSLVCVITKFDEWSAG